MKRFYLYLNLCLIFFGTISAMEEPDNRFANELRHEIIVNAEDVGHIITDHSSDFTIIGLNNNSSDGIEIQSKAFKEDNASLIRYLLSKNIPLSNTKENLIKQAIKKGAKRILGILKEYGFFNTELTSMQEKWLLEAIKRKKTYVVKFFLETLQFKIDKRDPKFAAATNNQEMIMFLSQQGFELSKDTEGILSKEACESNNIKSLIFLIKKDSPLNKEMVDLAIQEDEKNVLMLLKNRGFFDECEPKQLLYWLTHAIIDSKNECVEFFLDSFNFDYSIICDEKFLSNINSNQIKSLLIKNGEITKSLESRSSYANDSRYVFTIQDLFRYIRADNTVMVEHCLQSHDINVHHLNKNYEAETPLTLAVKVGCNTKIIDQLVAHDADIDLPNQEGYTPLALASQKANSKIVNLFIDLHASIDLACPNHCPYMSPLTPLTYALLRRNNKIAKALARKADLDLFDQKKRSPLMYAILTNNDEMISLFLNRLPSFENKALALKLAVELNQIKIVHLMLQHNADANYYSKKEKYTALHQAILQNNYEMTRLLLESSTIDEANKSRALSLAIKKTCPQFDIINLLLEFGADPDVVDRNGTSLLMYTADRGYGNLTELLLSYGANAKLVDNCNRSALMLAIRARHLWSSYKLLSYIEPEGIISELFILNKSDINKQDNDGNTALMYAAHANIPSYIKALLDYHADTNFVNNKGETALSILAKINEKNIYQKITNKCCKFIRNNPYLKHFHKIDDNNETQKNHHSMSSNGGKREKGKEKEQENSSIELIPVSSYKEDTLFDEYCSYQTLYDELTIIDEYHPNPLIELVEKFKKDEKYQKTLNLFDRLFKIEVENIYNCCSAILNKNSHAIKWRDHNKHNVMEHAIVNKNISAIKAFMPYVSAKDKRAAWMYAIGINDIVLIETLLPYISQTDKNSALASIQDEELRQLLLQSQFKQPARCIVS